VAIRPPHISFHIPSIIWKAEKFSPNTLPWQLYVHLLQAQLELGHVDQAIALGSKLLLRGDLPQDVQNSIQQLTEHTHEQTLH
jgi:hypothetical protein